MPIDFTCAVCKNPIRVPDGTEGKKTKCPKCNAIQKIPESNGPVGGNSPAGSSGGSDSGFGEIGSGSESSSSSSTGSSGLGDDFWNQSKSGSQSSSSDNPFADQPSNPYSSPQPYSGNASSYSSSSYGRNSREECKQRLQVPIIILMVLQGLLLGLSVIGVVFILAMLALENANDPGEIIPVVIAMPIGILFQSLTVFGLYNALNLKSKGLAWTGVILSMLPCSSGYCCIFTMPFAIWAIVVMADAEVNRNFDG